MSLIAKLRRSSDQKEVGRVLFRASHEDLRLRFDLRLGPCVSLPGPRGGRGKPLASPFDQWSDSIESLDALSAALPSRPDGAIWSAKATDGPGTLYTFSPEFVSALAALRDATTSQGILAAHEAAANSWLSRYPWPPDQQVGGHVARLLGDAWKATRAKERSEGLYCWTGPLIPVYSIASGRSAADYEEYRRSRTK